MSVTRLHLDDIIYQLQKAGGASVYWRQVTTRVCANNTFRVRRTEGSKLTRLLPVRTDADVFHSSHFRVPLFRNTPNVVTVYDFTYELGYLKTRGSAVNIFQRTQSIRRADALICISNNTKKDLLAIHPEIAGHPHIHVIHLAASFGRLDDPELTLSPRLAALLRTVKHKYILFVGARTAYKNFNAAILGFMQSQLPQFGYSIVCTGAAFNEAESSNLRKAGVEDKVVVLENASDFELNVLYQFAFALVYPSFYEGFGLPILEAMNCGCPTIVANTSSLPEIAGDAGMMIDPHDPSTISNALDALLDEATRTKTIDSGFLQARRFDWDATANQHIEIYRTLAAGQTAF